MNAMKNCGKSLLKALEFTSNLQRARVGVPCIALAKNCIYYAINNYIGLAP